jgi:hypothetical protein
MIGIHARALSALLLPLLSWSPSTATSRLVVPSEGEGRFEAYEEHLEQLSANALQSGRAYALLEELVHAAPHRLSGSEGAARAVEWARATMEALKFDAVRLEPCRVPHWERGAPEELVFVEPKELAGQPLPVLALGGSVGTVAEGIEGEVVIVESFRELVALGEAARASSCCSTSRCRTRSLIRSPRTGAPSSSARTAQRKPARPERSGRSCAR